MGLLLLGSLKDHPHVCCEIRKISFSKSPSKIVHATLSNITKKQKLSHFFSVDFDKLFTIFILETGMSSCRILGSGAILPVLGCILAIAKKCTL